MDIDSDKVKEMILAKENKHAKNNSIAIRFHLKLIQGLLSEGITRTENHLLQVRDFLQFAQINYHISKKQRANFSKSASASIQED